MICRHILIYSPCDFFHAWENLNINSTFHGSHISFGAKAKCTMYLVLWVGMCCIWCIPSWIWTIHYTSKNWKMYKRQFLAAAVALAVWALFSFLFNSMITQRGTFLTEGDLLMGENYLWLKSLKYILILFCQVLKPNLIHTYSNIKMYLNRSSARIKFQFF